MYYCFLSYFLSLLLGTPIGQMLDVLEQILHGADLFLSDFREFIPSEGASSVHIYSRMTHSTYLLVHLPLLQ